MRAYVDESGCKGMKFDSGSTETFTVAATLFKCPDHAMECSSKIEQLRQELRVTKEFHFSKCNHANRERFFHESLAFEFSYFAVVIDKLFVARSGMKFSESFLENLVTGLFSAAAEKLDQATIILDRAGSSDLRKSLSRNLKQSINSRYNREVIHRVAHKASHSDPLLQLADMVCGAVSRSFRQERVGKDTYRNMIRDKELAVSFYSGA